MGEEKVGGVSFEATADEVSPEEVGVGGAEGEENAEGGGEESAFLGGWVGGYRKVEEKQAVRMRCCGSRVGGWVT